MQPQARLIGQFDGLDTSVAGKHDCYGEKRERGQDEQLNSKMFTRELNKHSDDRYGRKGCRAFSG